MKPNQNSPHNFRRTDGSTARATRAFAQPKTDFSFQPAGLDDFGRCCGGHAQDRLPFRAISDGYFKDEARSEFVREGAMFALIVALVAVPLFQSASALLSLLR